MDLTRRNLLALTSVPLLGGCATDASSDTDYLEIQAGRTETGDQRTVYGIVWEDSGTLELEANAELELR